MAGKPGGVTPLQDLGTERNRGKQAVNRGGCIVRLGGAHQGLDIQLNCPNNTVVWEDVRGFIRATWSWENEGEGIRFAVLGSGAKGQGEIKSGKVERPAGLTGTQTFGSTNVLKVFMVSPYQEQHF